MAGQEQEMATMPVEQSIPFPFYKAIPHIPLVVERLRQGQATAVFQTLNRIQFLPAAQVAEQRVHPAQRALAAPVLPVAAAVGAAAALQVVLVA